MPIFQGFRDMFSLQMKVKMNGYHSSSFTQTDMSHPKQLARVQQPIYKTR